MFFGQRDKSILKAEEQGVKAGLDEAYAKGNWAAARQVLRSNNDELPFSTNRAVFPIVLIEADDPKAENAISDHSAYRPQEGVALKALSAIRKKRWEEAVDFSVEFIETLRKNPWVSDIVMARLFSQLPAAGKNVQGGPEKLIKALLESPFAVYAIDGERYQAAFAIAKADSDTDHCAALKNQKFYFSAGNAEYLSYLRKCWKDDKSVRAGIEEELQRIKQFQSPGFGQVMEYMNWEATQR